MTLKVLTHDPLSSPIRVGMPKQHTCSSWKSVELTSNYILYSIKKNSVLLWTWICHLRLLLVGNYWWSHPMSTVQCCEGAPSLLMVQESGFHHLECIKHMKPYENWDMFHINWLAGFLNHQQYNEPPKNHHHHHHLPSFFWGGVWVKKETPQETSVCLWSWQATKSPVQVFQLVSSWWLKGACFGGFPDFFDFYILDLLKVVAQKKSPDGMVV